jgi:hypothetical protein
MHRLFTLTLTALTAPLAAADFPKDARDRGQAATVKVTSADGKEGSGVLVGRGGPHTYALTASHVVATAKAADVRVGSGKTFKAEVLARSTDADLAVLRFPTAEGVPAPVQVAPVGTSPKAVVSVGWDKGDAPSALDETLKGKVRLRRPGESTSVTCWEVERKPAAGRSGGPLLGETGVVVGVAIGHDGATGYYVHADEVHVFLRQNGLKWLTDDGR